MKFIIFFLSSLLSTYIFPMDIQQAKLEIINNHAQPIIVRYEPRKEETNVVVPIGEWSCYINKTIDSKKSLVLPHLLRPLITITIIGFQPLENLPIVKTHIPLVINPEGNRKIRITQGENILAETKAQINISAVPQLKQSAEREKKESKEECCLQ